MNLETIAEKLKSAAKSISYEFSYYTGIGWKYLEEDNVRNYITRKIQRTMPNVGVNNHVVYLSLSPFAD